MSGQEPRIRWAPRVRPHKIRQLYENDAKGIVDEDLIDDVGYALYARCEAIWVVTERRCPKCKEKCQFSEDEEPILTCPGCGWSTTWKAYKRSYKGKRIHGGRAYGAFMTYMKEFSQAKGPREKMLAIDKVIHELHESLTKVWTIPAGVNLIEGKLDQVIELLDSLAYGDTSEGTMRSRKAAWQRRMAEGGRATEAYYAGKGSGVDQAYLYLEEDATDRAAR